MTCVVMRSRRLLHAQHASGAADRNSGHGGAWRSKEGDDSVNSCKDGRTGTAAGGSKDPVTVVGAEGAVRSATPQARQSFRPI